MTLNGNGNGNGHAGHPERARRFQRVDAVAPLRIVVVGFGYWGPNLVRNVIDRPGV
jgi:hypothetical protein